MKILHVIPYFSPLLGGTVKIAYYLSCWLVKEKHKVTVITTDYRYDPDYAKSLINVEIIPFNCIANIGQFLYSPEMKRWLKDNIRTYDIVHLHDYRSYQNIIVSKYADEFNIPYIIQPHGTLPRIIEKLRLKLLYDIVWGNNIIKHAKTIVAVSQTEVEQFRQVCIDDGKITIIPNGISITKPEDLPSPGHFRELYDIRQKHMILFVGRIHKIKGIDFLIRAFSLFSYNWKGEEVILVIVGPDEGYRSELVGLIEEFGLSRCVLFVDHLDNVDIAYQDADLLIYPSIYEIFGLVPFEALLHGTPVIVTDDCGCGEIIKEANCGYLVRYGDEAGLADMIRYGLEHPEENEKMVMAGKQYIKENLVWQNIVKKVEQMYHKITMG